MAEIVMITVEYDRSVVKFTAEKWKEIGGHVSLYVTNAMKTRTHPIVPSKDVNFNPVPYSDGSIAPRILIKIVAFGYPERREKLKRNELNLKAEIIAVFKAMSVRLSDEDPLLLIEYMDPSSSYYI